MRKITFSVIIATYIAIQLLAQSQPGIIEVSYQPCQNCQVVPTPSSPRLQRGFGKAIAFAMRNSSFSPE